MPRVDDGGDDGGDPVRLPGPPAAPAAVLPLPQW
jgi:hypothetical protein